METSSESDSKEIATGDGTVLLLKLEIWMPAAMVDRIRRLLQTGLYGRIREEAAERLIAAQLEYLEKAHK